MSGQWPPEWEDAAPGFPEERGHQQDPDTDARLSEVSAALAAVDMPALPEVFEARISAAIAAEAAARPAAGSKPEPEPGSGSGSGSGSESGSGPRVLEPAKSRPRLRRARLSRRIIAIGSALACMLLAVVGYALAGRGTTGPVASSAAAPNAAASSAAAAANAPSASGASGASGMTGEPFAGLRPDHANRSVIGASARFMVTASGTRYTKAALVSQVRAELTAAGTISGKTAPSSALEACVLRLTGNVTPSLVDRATYLGRRAYIIAVPSRAWVVGTGCTAADPQLITSVSLAG